jgi:hypothetical protein
MASSFSAVDDNELFHCNRGCVQRGLIMAFQRKKPAAIGIKAPYPSFIEPALADL